MTTPSATHAVAILAAGKGTRMRSPRPKVLHPLCGRPLVHYVLDQASALDPRKILLVLGDRSEPVQASARAYAEEEGGPGGSAAIEFVRQEPQLGTGHALQCCLEALAGGTGSVVVLYGDMPALRPETLVELVAARPEGGASLLVAELDDPTGYGRILRDPADPTRVTGIVEEKDASAEQRAVREVNVGVYALPAEELPGLLGRLSNDNAQGEYYLTDLVELLVGDGRQVRPVVLADDREARGVNTLAQLGEARAIVQERILEEHLAAGVLIEDPATTYIDHGVTIGAGTHVLPCTVIRRGVTIGEGCEVGPFSHLRVGSTLADGAEVGNFTETKKATLGEGVKAKHLSYLGDVTIGRGTNIGAGTIVANYDGVAKHHTDIGEDAFVGSGSVLIAPSKVGRGATTGGGAIVTRNSDVPDGDVWVGIPARPIRRRGDGDS